MRLVLVIALTVLTPTKTWIGSELCGTCHPAELAGWQRTAHARAAEVLGARPRARCLACHGTGDAPAGRAAALEVGCEACHGAGAHYAEDDIMRDPLLARALGLRDAATACAGCHRGTGTRLSEPALTEPPH